jgi:hypothetical protein
MTDYNHYPDLTPPWCPDCLAIGPASCDCESDTPAYVSGSSDDPGGFWS